MEISHSDIGKKVCNGSHATGKKGNTENADMHGYGPYSEKEDQANKTAQCSGLLSAKANGDNGGLKKFVDQTKVGEGKTWPTGYMHSASGNKIDEKGEANSNAKAVAKDLVALDRDEKIKVAGLLAKTIEGGEVVEIRAVSSTSVMVNACCDVLSKNLRVVPYACVGLGGNFVGVVDGHITPKLAYRLKAGLSYQLSPEISAFAGGFYHRVVGDGVYDDLPAQRLADDITLAAHTKNTAVASFVMRYFGGEFGIRFAF
ncbi:Major surface antigen 4 precursor [Anaplasma phagocytophilum]|nr:Major surface antigen 4 precursor [Anaplasma phagocytophilum]SCV66735.1 Major surface antigen 4 precursor [Anaplasma phagocytophilum]